jgi:hypothetical protein
MAEYPLNAGTEANRTASDSGAAPRPIRPEESDAWIQRLKAIMGDESVSSFARRCGFSESVLRGYLVSGKKPGLDYLVAIAEAGSVTIDWLATGRPPKTRAEARAARAAIEESSTRSAGPAINAGALAALIEGMMQAAPNAPPKAQAEQIAKVYKDLLDKGLITPEGIGKGHLNSAA